MTERFCFTERFYFTNDAAGLEMRDNLVASLVSAGFTTETTTETIGRFTVVVLTATPAPRASRKERGL